MQIVKNLVGIAAAVFVLIGFSFAVKDGFQKTFGPFDDVKVKYKWMDRKTGDSKCVAKAPGEQPTPCDQKSKEELSEYKLLWETPRQALVEAAYSRRE